MNQINKKKHVGRACFFWDFVENWLLLVGGLADGTGELVAAGR